MEREAAQRNQRKPSMILDRLSHTRLEVALIMIYVSFTELTLEKKAVIEMDAVKATEIAEASTNVEIFFCCVWVSR